MTRDSLRFRPLGLVFRPDGHAPWMLSHAANPVALHLDGTRYRFYFSCRDGNQRSSVGFVEVDIRRPTEVLAIADRPALAPGADGAFDDSGCSLACLLWHEGELRMYYMGWNLGVRAPWRNAVGVAVSEDGGRTFRRPWPGPIFDRDPHDAYSVSYPHVLPNPWAEGLVMFYGTHLAWGTSIADMTHGIKRATSVDGISWTREHEVLVGPTSGGPAIASRPWILKDGRQWSMLFSHRGERYRIGRAVSQDGRVWQQSPLEGLDPQPGSWHSEMVCYASEFVHDGRRYLLYCGDDFGRTGFGIATEEE